MLQIFNTRDNNGYNELIESTEIGEGSWINMVRPTMQEIEYISENLQIPMDFIRAALDEEERARIESEDGYTLIIIDIPIISDDTHVGLYSTIPMGIIIGDSQLISICLRETPIITDFSQSKVKGFYTYKKTRFLFQILYRNATYYLQFLRQIDRESSKIEKELHRSMKNKELIQLLDLEKSLVYFSTSLKSNEGILEKMLRSRPLKMYPEDEELLEDVIIENKQAIEMSTIYSGILSGTMDAFASIISNNLNIVMKFLASITIVLSIPTMVASFFGMNVVVPMENYPHAFLIIFIMSFVFSGILGFFMFKKDLF